MNGETNCFSEVKLKRKEARKARRKQMRMLSKQQKEAASRNESTDLVTSVQDALQKKRDDDTAGLELLPVKIIKKDLNEEVCFERSNGTSTKLIIVHCWCVKLYRRNVKRKLKAKRTRSTNTNRHSKLQVRALPVRDACTSTSSWRVRRSCSRTSTE